MPLENKTVRDYISPADSADVVDFLIDEFNRSDIPELYSEHLATIPVKEVPGKYKKDRATGEYFRYLDEKGKVKRKEIELETDTKAKGYRGDVTIKAEKHPDVVSKDIKYKRTPRGTMIHEAFGHGLLDVLYGYHKKPHFTRTETFPIMLSVYSQLKRLEREGMSKDHPYYKQHLDAFNELKNMSDKTLSLPERKFDMNNPQAPQLRKFYE